MYKTLTLTLVGLLFIYHQTQCQQDSFCQNEEIDLVINVNGIVQNTINGAYFYLEGKENQKPLLPIYHPGSLTFNKEDFKRLMSEDVNYLRFKFYIFTGKKENDGIAEYSIRFKSDWFKEKYIVLSLYDLNRKEYKKSRRPIEKNVNFSGSISLGSYTISNLDNTSSYNAPKIR